MPTLGLIENVNPALKPGKCAVVDKIKETVGSFSLGTVGNLASAAFSILGILGLLTGWIVVGSNNARELQSLQKQLGDAQQQSSVQFEKLSAKLDTKLGPDAMTDTVRRLSEISGQLSALDMRERQDQDVDRSAIIRMQTQIEQILASQKKP